MTLLRLCEGCHEAHALSAARGSGLRGRALRPSFDEYELVETRPVADLTWELYVLRPYPKPPGWLADLASIVEGDRLANLRNQLCSALLFVTRGERRFILAYGGGHFVIDREYIEPGFGLRVVANVVAGSSGIMSADTRGLNQTARSQRTVLPVASALYELGIEPSDEWVRQLTGKPSAQGFANTASGSDSLKLSIRGFKLSSLGDKLDRIIERYESNDYKRDFDFLDYFTRVGRDEKLLAQLRAEVATRVAARAPDLELASPEPLEPLDVHYYRLRHGHSKSAELPELHRDALYAQLDEWGDVTDPLGRVRVWALGDADNPLGDTYNLFDYVIADVLLKGKRYVLSAGNWFVIDPDYVSQVEQRISLIPDLTEDLSLPSWEVVAGDEAYYNKEVSDQFGWKLLDKKNFPVSRPNQKIEICDLLTADKQLVCVKKLRRSATLSHLFAQGFVSAQLLVSEEERYRPTVLDYLRELEPAAEFGNPSDWTVVYAIATEKSGPLGEALPFFSKVNLDRTVRSLRGIGVKFAVAKVPLVL